MKKAPDPSSISALLRPFLRIHLALAGMSSLIYMFVLYFTFTATRTLYKAGPVYEAALAGKYTPFTTKIHAFILFSSLSMIVLSLITARLKFRRLGALQGVVALGFVAGALLMNSHAGSNHSPDFLRGFGERFIKTVDITHLKSIAADTDSDPERALALPQKEVLGKVLERLPEYSIGRVPTRKDIIILTYGRVVEIMIGPDDLPAPPDWDPKRAVKAAPGVFVIGGESVW